MESNKIKSGLIKFNPVAVSILLSLPLMAQAADINIQGGTVATANGVPIININTANDHGISHNVYDQLNVDKSGLIFNNATNSVNTVLAGQIAGNSNLTSGSAKVILNEVTSTSRSALNGMMEVAGDKAHLIIANPNGITVQGGSFINAEKATITTGKPDMQNGELKGYSVNGGTAIIKGLRSDSPTEILARSVVVDGQVSVNQLDMVAGNNYVNTDAKVVGAVSAKGLKSTYAVDVSKLSGMYANRISLISTEDGVGVRNAGAMVGGDAGIKIDSKGRLINSNAEIKSAGDIYVKTNGVLENISGKIIGNQKLYIDTNKNTVSNTLAGNISSVSDINIDSGAFDNTNGNISSGGKLALNSNNQTLTNSGKGKSVGIKAGSIVLKTGALNNNNGVVDSYGNVDISSTGDINNTKGLIRSSMGHIQLDTASTLTNGSTKSADTTSSDSLGILAGDGGIKVTAGTLNNRGGQIASTKDVILESKGAIDNYNGKAISSTHVLVKGNSLNNSQGGIGGKKGIKIDVAGNFDNIIGVVSSEEGDIGLNAQRVNNSTGLFLGENINIKSSSSVNNSNALMVANKKLTIDAASDVNNSNGNSFGRNAGLYFGIPDQVGGLVGREGVEIIANSVNNDNSRIIANNGPLKMEVIGNIANNKSLLVGGGDTNIKAKAISNNYSTISSAGNLTINTNSLSNLSSGSIASNNATGVIASDRNLTLNVNSNFTNYGWINAEGDGTVNIKGHLYNRNTINAGNKLEVKANTGLTNYKDIVAGNNLTVSTEGSLTNNPHSNIFTNGHANVSAKIINTSGKGSILGGQNGTELIANKIIYRKGNVVGW